MHFSISITAYLVFVVKFPLLADSRFLSEKSTTSNGVARIDWQRGQWRSQDLVVVGALEGWSMGRGLPFPRGKSLGRGPCPSPENFGFLV